MSIVPSHQRDVARARAGNVRLPAGRAPGPAPAIDAEPPIATVLVIEECDVGRDAVCAYLEDLGYLALDARTVDEAAVLAAHVTVDVVVIDGSLVDSGAIARLGAGARRARILVTRYPEDAPVDGCAALVQPFTLRGLAAAVREVRAAAPAP